MRAITALLVLAAAALAATEIDFSFSGKNLTDAEGQFGFRTTQLLNLAGTGVAWVSASVGASGINGIAKGNADVAAAISLHPTATSPAAIGVYFSGKFEGGVSSIAEKVLRGGFAADATAGVIGFALPAILEVQKDGAVSAVHPLSTEGLNVWSAFVPVTSGLPEGVHASKATRKVGDATATLTLIASDRAGILKYGNTPVSPNSLEFVLEIDGYKYLNNKNHLELVFAGITVTASASGSASGEFKAQEVVTKNKNGQEVAYAAVSGKAVVDGKSAEVTVKAAVSSDDKAGINSGLQAYINAAFGAFGTVNTKYQRIAFPAGASKIVYDPAIGSGSNVYKAGASTIVLSVVAVILAIALLF